MNSKSTKTLAGEVGLIALLLVEGDLMDCLGGVVSSSIVDNTLKSLRSNASILYYNISNPYIQAERRS